MASSEAQKFAELLRTIAAAIESSGVPETSELIRELERQLRFDSRRERSLQRKTQQASDVGQLVTILDGLQRSETRREAASILRNNKLTRKELMELAKIGSVHITKDDNISRIEEKLIEASVGSRLNSEAIRGTSRRFSDINSRIISETESKILDEVVHHRFRFVFNPESGASKELTFGFDGAIGEGRNSNEYRWRISNGRIEILNEHGEIYSRFLRLPDGRFQHTNDDDTQSIKGQYFEPMGGGF